MTSSDELALAIIGAGSIGTRHLSNLEFIGKNRVVAVCDADDGQASKMAARAGSRVYASVDEMFDTERSLDAVLICVPPGIRRQVFERAAERNVAVFCEKPPADSLEHAADVARILRDSGIVCMAGFNQRYLPVVDCLRERVTDRKISMVLSTYLSWFSPGGPRSWFYVKEKSGGPLLDQAIHSIDLMRFIAGDIQSVHTLGNNVARPKGPGFTVEDSTVSTLQFVSGAIGYHVHSWGAPWGATTFALTGADFHLRLEVSGSPGVYGTIGDPNGDGTPVHDEVPQGRSLGRSGDIPADRSPEDPPDFMHYGEMITFLDAVRTRNTSAIRSSYEDAMRSLAVVLAMNKSIDSGQVEPVVVPTI